MRSSEARTEECSAVGGRGGNGGNGGNGAMGGDSGNSTDGSNAGKITLTLTNLRHLAIFEFDARKNFRREVKSFWN